MLVCTGTTRRHVRGATRRLYRRLRWQDHMEAVFRKMERRSPNALMRKAVLRIAGRLRASRLSVNRMLCGLRGSTQHLRVI
jgi:hypothetical protein